MSKDDVTLLSFPAAVHAASRPERLQRGNAEHVQWLRNRQTLCRAGDAAGGSGNRAPFLLPLAFTSKQSERFTMFASRYSSRPAEMLFVATDVRPSARTSKRHEKP